MKRFSYWPESNENKSGIFEHNHGEYVMYEDAEKLQKRITELEHEIEKMNDIPDAHVIRMAEQAQRIAELEEKLRWIPVSERYPSPIGKIEIIQKDFNSEGHLIEVKDIINSRNMHCSVTHWREVPEL
jgi:hypothetical protein